MSEYHVSSLVVHAMADKTDSVKKLIEQIAGAEVHATSESGKIVVVVEGRNRSELADRFDQIKLLPSVLAATLIFHQVDDDNQTHNIALDGVLP